MDSSNVSVCRNRYAIAALPLIVFASWFRSAHPACGAEPASDEIVVQSPILDDGSMVTIPIRMGKRTYLFAVDTASTGTIFDPLLVSELGKRGQTIDANGTSGAVPVELYDGPSDMWIGKERVSFPKKVGVMSMAETQRFNRVPIMGILGLEPVSKLAFAS